MSGTRWSQVAHAAAAPSSVCTYSSEYSHLAVRPPCNDLPWSSLQTSCNCAMPGTAVGELVEVGTIEEADLSNANKEVITLYISSGGCTVELCSKTQRHVAYSRCSKGAPSSGAGGAAGA